MTRMPSPHHSPFLTIRAEGALLPIGLLQRVVENDQNLGGLTPESYHLSGNQLLDAHQRVRLASRQKGVQTHVEPNLPPDVPGIYVYLPVARG